MNITWRFCIESANAPTNGASSTYETVKKICSSGVTQAAERITESNAMAAINSALSASDEMNCAAMMV